MKCPECHFENPDDTVYCGKCGKKFQPPEDISISRTKTLKTPIKELTRGTTFAKRYEFIEELGKGGMGRVYKVYDRRIKEEVALKLLKPEIADDEDTIERFSNELKFARKIVHKNVGRMYDLNEEEGAFFITMEYVPGEDLKSSLRRMGPLSAGKAIFITKQICEGLAEAHKLGVVHRDLKPQNIMIDKEGNARVMDFGIARSLRTKRFTDSGVMIGTPEYMSPEQVEGKKVDQRSDIYSLGVILYEMMTGRVPFEGDTAFSVALKHKTKTPKNPREINAQVPEDLSRLIMKCMEKDKEKRYQSAGEVCSDLESVEQGIPDTEKIVPKRRPLTTKEITVTLSLRRLLFPGLIVVALAIIAVVIWQLLPRRKAAPIPSYEHSVAVISFENQTGEEAYDYLRKAIPNLLITRLEQSGYLSVTTWERMYDLLKQMGNAEVEIIDRDLGFELCRTEGVEAIVLGSFVKAGDMFATDVKVLDVESKSLLKSASSKGMGIQSILESQIDELSEEISRGVGLSERKINAIQLRIAEATTTSMDAYNFFLRGREDKEKYYFDDARRFLEKAVETDPAFALAYRYLADVYDMLGNTKARDEAIKKAKELSMRATAKGRLFIEAAYATHVERDSEKRFRILKELVKNFPKEKRAHYDLGIEYKGRGLFHEAAGEFNQALELDPSYGYAINELAYTYSYMGNFEKAIEYFEKYSSVSPGDANPLDSMAEMYLRMGKLDEALVKYRETLEVKPDFGSDWEVAYIYALREDYSESQKWIAQFLAKAPSAGAKAEGYVWKGLYHYWLGSFDQAMIELRRAEEIAESVGNDLWKAWADYVRGWIHYDRGEYEPSRECFKSWFDIMIKNFPSSVPFFKALYNVYLGYVDLGQRQIDSTKSRLAEMKTLINDLNPPSKGRITFRFDLLNAEVLLAEGSFDQAISVLEKALPLGMIRSMFTWYVISYNAPFLKDAYARAYKQKGDIDKAISEYEKLIIFDPTSLERFLIHPKYHYRLAELYEEKGLAEKASLQYQKFLELWKNADPDLPEVRGAKKRLDALRSE
ncbi:MAG: protein kinase [Candidatus Aminicenantes bacterium]|nr:protein kinase [Candidatus Aminicenantes bacterium]